MTETASANVLRSLTRASTNSGANRAVPDGYVESLSRKLRDELLNGEIFPTLREAMVVVEMWRQEYDELRPHSARIQAPGHRSGAAG